MSPTYCRQHVEHIARHGSSWRKTLNGAELLPYRKATVRWLKANAASPFVQAAETTIERIMAEAGKGIISPLLHEEGPESRAKQVLARMRDRGVSPRTVLAEAVAAAVAVRSLEGIPRDNEYWTVQIAKRVHRLGSAFRLTYRNPDGTKGVWQWHPEPRGQMLRHLGRMVEEALDLGISAEDFKAIAASATPAV